MSEENNEQTRAAINAIEAGYEFMLAYAAQGRDFEYSGGGGGPSIRPFLQELVEGLNSVADHLEASINDQVQSDADLFLAFVSVLRIDAEKSMKAVKMVLALPSIGSQVIDNLNASIHLRALLTDIFLIDEAMTSLSRKE